MKTDVQGVLERLELAERVALKLAQPEVILSELPAKADERSWLVVAARRLAASVEILRARVEEALALPELKSLRVEREQRLEQEWVGAIRQLLAELVREVGATSPLVESLFPHQRFEKLDRGGAALRTFRSEYEGRRASSYVRRLEADPEHPRLASLLETVDRASTALLSLAAPSDDDAAAALRERILEAGQGLERTLQQARYLCEAALIEHPARLLDLGFNDRAKKRSARAPAERDAEPS